MQHAGRYAEVCGPTCLADLQFEHGLVQRSSKHELLLAGQPLGLVAWSPLG